MPKWYEKYILIVGTAGGFIPWIQFIKILIEQSAKDVSVIAYIILLIVVISWAIYGYFLRDKPLIIANVISIIGTIACLGGIMWYS